MPWLRRDDKSPWIDSAEIRGWIRRGDKPGGSSEAVVTTRDYPGMVTSRTIRNDVYQDALRAAESTLRNTARKK
jgi:hypothetical protein